MSALLSKQAPKINSRFASTVADGDHTSSAILNRYRAWVLKPDGVYPRILSIYLGPKHDNDSI